MEQVFLFPRTAKLATNRHVVYPVINNANILTSLKIKFDNIKFKILDDQKAKTDSITEIDNFISTNLFQLDPSSLQALNERKQTLYNDRTVLSNLYTEFDFVPSKTTIKSKSIFLGIAYDNTFVNKQSDF